MQKVLLSTIVLVVMSFSLLTITNYGAKAQNLEFREVAGNLEVIWEMRLGPDNNIWLTERPGRVQRVNLQTGEKTLLLDITDDVLSDNFSERGLMGMAFSPYFVLDNNVFLAYNYEGVDGTTIKIVRYTYQGGKLKSPITILDGIRGETNHDGCRLEFAADGKLYVTTGDATNTSLPQNRNSINGKVLRLNPDGTIPEDNPYYGSKTFRGEVWSFGHRNPQGLVYHKEKIYSSEHGANTNDELNLIEKGRNYGWPDVEGFCDEASEQTFCEENNVREPIGVFDENSTLAVAGIDFYDVKKDVPYEIKEWQNSILMVTLKTGLLLQLKLSPDGKEIVSQKTIINGEYGRLRSVRVLPDGRVLVGTSNKDGRGDEHNNDDKIIEIKLGSGTGVENKDKGELYEIYPNPSSKYINFKSSSHYPTEVSIFDMLGNKVKQFEAMPFSTETVDLNGVQSGQYNFQILSNGNITYKIVNIIN